MSFAAGFSNIEDVFAFSETLSAWKSQFASQQSLYILNTDYSRLCFQQTIFYLKR